MPRPSFETTSPDLERVLARRMGGTTIGLPSSHLAVSLGPNGTTALIVRAASPHV